MSKSGTFHLITRLHFDLAHQPKLIAGETEIDLTLKQSSPSFYLMAAADSKYKVKIHKAKLYVRRVVIAPSVPETHEKAVIEHGPFDYPVNSVEVTTYAIPRDNRDDTYTHSNTGQLPKAVTTTPSTEITPRTRSR